LECILDERSSPHFSFSAGIPKSRGRGGEREQQQMVSTQQVWISSGQHAPEKKKKERKNREHQRINQASRVER
jgi:hypothetical protein